MLQLIKIISVIIIDRIVVVAVVKAAVYLKKQNKIIQLHIYCYQMAMGYKPVCSYR
jgi:hypothetical protein